jgi:formiminotetrahydrofolate cyclodeaminase
LNVLINLGTLKDEGYVVAARRELADLGANIEGLVAEVLSAVRERL